MLIKGPDVIKLLTLTQRHNRNGFLTFRQASLHFIYLNRVLYVTFGNLPKIHDRRGTFNANALFLFASHKDNGLKLKNMVGEQMEGTKQYISTFRLHEDKGVSPLHFTQRPPFEKLCARSVRFNQTGLYRFARITKLS